MPRKKESLGDSQNCCYFDNSHILVTANPSYPSDVHDDHHCGHFEILVAVT